MKSKKALLFFGCIIVGLLLYVFGAMYITNKNQSGGNASNNASNANTQTGAATNNSPSNTGTSAHSQGAAANQQPHPSGAVQGSFIQQAPIQNVLAPTQAISAQRQTSNDANAASGMNQTSLQQQSQNNSIKNSQPQITQNPIGGM